MGRRIKGSAFIGAALVLVVGIAIFTAFDDNTSNVLPGLQRGTHASGSSNGSLQNGADASQDASSLFQDFVKIFNSASEAVSTGIAANEEPPSVAGSGAAGDSLIGDPATPVPYGQIISEIADKDYRESVEIAENAFCVIREESSNSKPVEEEAWYKKAGATGYEVIMTQEGESEGIKVVSYRITIPEEDVWSVVDSTNEDGSVEIAEPEYIYTVSGEDGSGNDGASLNALAVGELSASNPGASKQWYLDDQTASDIWADSATYGVASGEGSVVAVIDTGVDYTHEDLSNNIWLNTIELNGEEGVDDDGNGYTDDIYGINLIDPARTPQDDHGHGTHVAGIIAMEDNDLGGMGLAYEAKVMVIKAGGSDGSFNSSDIAKALNYAYRNGADVINMSFGSSAHSAIVEGALQDAFSSCVLVAAAGNDNMPTKDSMMMGSYNCYPAAYSYVIGVMSYASDGSFSSFSNYDWKANYGAEYEIAAPGSAIYSTLPGNRYASWNGTSMAAPVVSAAAAIVRSSHPDKDEFSSRYIMGQICSATEQSVYLVNGYGTFEYSKLCLGDSLTKAPKPNINIDEVYVFDSTDISDANNGDGLIQPGETIDFAVGLRNQWGAATDVNLTIDASSSGGVANPYVEYVSGQSVPIEDIGTFGTQDNGFVYNDEGVVTGVSKPVRVKISEDAPNDLNINFLLNYTAKNALDSSDETIYTQLLPTSYAISVIKGTIVEGKITKDATWTKDNYYIIKNGVSIPRGVTVTVEPGTQIQFWASDQSSVYGDTYMPSIEVRGKLIVNGTEAEPVEMFPGKDFEAYQVEMNIAGNGSITMSYATIINPYVSITSGDHLAFQQDYDQSWYRDYDTATSNTFSSTRRSMVSVADTLSYSKLSNFRGVSLWEMAYVYGSFESCLFDDCQISFEGIKATNCVFLNNQGRYENSYSGVLEYFTSRINNVGNLYREPQYETATTIHTYNGKKYIAYRFDNYYFSTYWDAQTNMWVYPTMDNYRGVEAALEAKGGNLAVIDAQSDESAKELLVGMRDELSKLNGDSTLYLLSGYHYDSEAGKAVTVTGTDIPENYYVGGLSKNAPIDYYTISKWQEGVYNEETGETEYVDRISADHSSGYTEMGVGNCWFVLAEYPESVDDYAVENPVFSLDDITIESDSFTNNAILNRLTSTNASDWMKVSASSDNTYTFSCAGNYWGTTNTMLIQKQVSDFDTNIRLADIITSPELQAPTETMYPCVSDVYITDKNGEKATTLGNGEYTVHVLFNRDMDSSVNPMVTYGPDDPYTDYTFSGDWVSAREWVGTTTVKILINQGTQYVRVKDAVAADDAWLTTGVDWARFSFQIEGTGAEALTLQGEGVKGGVYLNWNQDEYETMAGFNVYRSETGEEGTYEKANSSIISPEEREFTDTKVTSGKKYHYYFTVVDTDLTESRPSNIIVCASLDDQAPVIRHTASTSSLTYGVAAPIVATVTDNVGVNVVKVFYRMAGDETYKQVSMVNTNEDTYSAQIPARDLAIGTLEYYIAAADSESWGYSGSADEPYSVEVETKMAVTSVAADDGEVGSTIAGSVKGMNFDEGLSVRIDGQVLETTYVNSGELSFTFVPTYMGKKKVEIVDDAGNRIAAFANAFTVTDSSVEVFGGEGILIKEQSEWQYVYINSNYSGKLETLEITAKCPWPISGSIEINPSYGWTGNDGNDSYEESYFIYDRTYKMANNTRVEGGNLFYLGVYNYDGSYVPELLSVKINGVEIGNLSEGFSNIALVDEGAFVSVDEIEAIEPTVTLDVGQSFTPEFVVTPSNATRRNMVTYSFDSNWLQQNADGSFTLLRSGGTYLYAYCEGKQAQVYVYGNPIPITSITADKPSYSGVVGSTITINWTAEPLESDVYLGYFTSWDGNYVQEIQNDNNGRTRVFRLKKAGEIDLGIAAYDETTGEYIWCYVPVTILENTAYTEIDEDIVSLYPNQQQALTSRVRNAGDGEAEITWASSNTAVATVSSDGTVSAVGKGYAVITASIENGAKRDSTIVLVGTDSMSYTLGDVNMDGSVTAVDSMLALKLALLDDVVSPILTIADVNNDGGVSAGDAMLILQYVTGAITEF